MEFAKRLSARSRRNSARNRGASHQSTSSTISLSEVEQREDYSLDMKNLKLGVKLGSGNFSTVFKATLGNEVIAVKKQELTDKELESYLRKELAVLRRCHHVGLVRYIAAGKLDNYVYIATEYLPGGDLRRLLARDFPIGWKTRVGMVAGVAAALAYLHARGIIHRDIKTDNVLLDTHLRPKLCDFGFARKNDPGRVMTMCGTDEFMAPEVLFGMNYDEKADIFSFGVVLGELISRKAPGKTSGFLDRQPKDGFAVDFDELHREYENFSELPKSLGLLCDECLQSDPDSRPSAKEAQDWLDELFIELPADSIPAPTITEDAVLAAANMEEVNRNSMNSVESLGDLRTKEDGELDPEQYKRIRETLQRTSMAFGKMSMIERLELEAKQAGLTHLLAPTKEENQDGGSTKGVVPSLPKPVESMNPKQTPDLPGPPKVPYKPPPLKTTVAQKLQSTLGRRRNGGGQRKQKQPPKPKQEEATTKTLPISLTAEEMKTFGLIKQGYIIKRGGRFKSWKRRFMVLTDEGLVYFRNRHEFDTGATPKGAILFENMVLIQNQASIKVPNVKTGRPYSFQIHTAARNYFVCAENPADQESWVSHINRGRQHYDIKGLV